MEEVEETAKEGTEVPVEKEEKEAVLEEEKEPPCLQTTVHNDIRAQIPRWPIGIQFSPPRGSEQHSLLARLLYSESKARPSRLEALLF